jgi:hypothetical protein
MKEMDGIQTLNFLQYLIAEKQFETIADLSYYLNNKKDDFINQVDEFQVIVDSWGDEDEEILIIDDWDIGDEYEEISVNKALILD